MSDNIVSIKEADIEHLLGKAHVMLPAMCLGANVRVGVNPNLVTEEEVATVELLLLTPGDHGDEVVIMPIIMSPELAEGLGLSPTQEETE